MIIVGWLDVYGASQKTAAAAAAQVEEEASNHHVRMHWRGVCQSIMHEPAGPATYTCGGDSAVNN